MPKLEKTNPTPRPEKKNSNGESFRQPPLHHQCLRCCRVLIWPAWAWRCEVAIDELSDRSFQPTDSNTEARRELEAGRAWRWCRVAPASC